MNTSDEILTINATAVVRHYLGINTKQATSVDELVSDGDFCDRTSALRALSSGLSDLRSSAAHMFGSDSDLITTRSNSSAHIVLKRALTDLSEREHRILTLRYGLQDEASPQTLHRY